MILADTSVWVDHLRGSHADLGPLLDRGQILNHPYVTGELALGNLQGRSEILTLLQRLPNAVVAQDEEVLLFIDNERLTGAAIGYVDACLLAAARLTPETRFWTRDRRLGEVALKLGLAFTP